MWPLTEQTDRVAVTHLICVHIYTSINHTHLEKMYTPADTYTHSHIGEAVDRQDSVRLGICGGTVCKIFFCNSLIFLPELWVGRTPVFLDLMVWPQAALYTLYTTMISNLLFLSVSPFSFISFCAHAQIASLLLPAQELYLFVSAVEYMLNRSTRWHWILLLSTISSSEKKRKAG